jgi:hypothetical protein
MERPERVEDYLGHSAEAITRATGYLQPPERFCVIRMLHEMNESYLDAFAHAAQFGRLFEVLDADACPASAWHAG